MNGSANAAPQANTIMEARGITKRFQGLVSVDRVSFSLAEHEILGLIGPNGAGKTTLVNMIGGTLKPNEGELLFEGERINDVSPYRRAHLGIARTFQIMKPFPFGLGNNSAMSKLFVNPFEISHGIGVPCGGGLVNTVMKLAEFVRLKP